MRKAEGGALVNSEFMTSQYSITPLIRLGKVPIGSAHPVAKQTMATTVTKDVEASVAQVFPICLYIALICRPNCLSLYEYGCLCLSVCIAVTFISCSSFCLSELSEYMFLFIRVSVCLSVYLLLFLLFDCSHQHPITI